MRIVHLGDLHLDAKSLGVSRFDESYHALCMAVGDAIEWKADLLLCTGDFFDPDCGPVAYSCLRVLQEQVVLARARGVRVALLAGNHDVQEDGSGTTVLTPLLPLARSDYGVDLHVLERPGSVLVGTARDGRGVLLHALPFTASSHDYDPAAFMRAAPNTPDMHHVIASHLNVRGIMPGEETNEMPRGRAMELPLEVLAERFPSALVLQGHIHQRQTFRSDVPGCPPIHVAGAVMRITMGERDHEPAYTRVEF